MTRSRAAGYAAIAAAIPTVVWRVIVGLGPTLGTPASWRSREQLPGAGTGYVVVLSVLQLVAALLTLVLILPGADTVPARSPIFAGRRLPAWLVVGAASAGAVVLAAVCALSIVNWHNVDPFGDAPGTTAWSVLCTACYAVALAWPVLLAVAIVGYAGARGPIKRVSRSNATG